MNLRGKKEKRKGIEPLLLEAIKKIIHDGGVDIGEQSEGLLRVGRAGPRPSPPIELLVGPRGAVQEKVVQEPSLGGEQGSVYRWRGTVSEIRRGEVGGPRAAAVSGRGAGRKGADVVGE